MSISGGNWQRGAFRLWVVASLLWVAGMGWYQYHEDKKSPPPGGLVIEFSKNESMKVDSNAPPEDADPSTCDKYFSDDGAPRSLSALVYRSREECIAALRRQHHEYVTAQLKRAAPVVLPPLLVLLLFPALTWVRRGFKSA